MTAEILKPVAVLAAWTMIMWIWMYWTRIPAMRRAGIDAKTKIGGTGKDLDGLLPDNIQWKAHNYNHLMEQPTVFYAVALMLAMIGQGNGWNAWLAWGYAGLRVIHSLVHVTTNRVLIRFLVFSLATLCLIALTLHALLAVFGWHAH